MTARTRTHPRSCTRAHGDWHALAGCLFPTAEWIAGEGPFAVLAWCRVLTVTLHPTRADADASREWIDRCGCGGRCHRAHDVVRLIRREGVSP